MTKIHFSDVFDLCPWFLAHSSQKPWNFLSYKSNGSIFGYIWSLVLFLKSLRSHKGEMGVLFITRPFSPQLGLC